MKKVLALLLAVVALLCCLVGCSDGDKYNHESFHGVVRLSEETNRLVLYIPKYGEVEIPDSEGCFSPFDEYTPDDKEDGSCQLKPGDLVVIHFNYEKSWDDNSVKIMETYPAKFDRKAERIEVLRENISFEKNDNGYVLTFPSTDEIDSAKVGDTLYFVRHGGENGKAFTQLYASGVINDKTDGHITVTLTIPEGETEFLDYYTRMTVELTWEE